MIREFLMQLVAGNKRWWISDKAVFELKEFGGSSVSTSAAIALVTAMENAEANKATYKLDGWEITVTRKISQQGTR